MYINDRFIVDLIMTVISNEQEQGINLCSITYADGTRNTPTVEQTTAIRLSTLRETLKEIFEED